ncbi:GMC oxidoreductase [Erythrobacter litoralis]|uniref:Oxidoreductase, putative n=1 Tax=Erythrobacter litoralis (strain HTCC2594) TaxID=314225 RepID=Q2N8A7_ERYLH|nr:GMC oxidoreductase [Erythrobacter litoralis]ABC64084.1 oxidoreductase, putative [Erythrobacter litoralis HTCC2594]
MIVEPDAPLPERVETLVIGAGTIGLPLAVKLAETTGKPVLCLDSGGWSQAGDTHPLNAVEQRGDRYDGADLGRFRGLGGTSTRWGGALIPFQPADMTGWPVSSEELAPFIGEVEQLFGLDPGTYHGSDPMLDGPDMVPRLAKWPPFAKRNVWKLLEGEVRRSDTCSVALENVVTNLASEADAIRVEIARPNAWHVIHASKVIIAAGAIETTRLALLLDRAMDGAVSRMSPLLGRTFGDHLSVEVGRIVPRDRVALNRLFGFRFARSGMMRNLRFELAPETPLRETVRPGFVHVGYATDGDTGFDHLRAAMQAVQRGTMPSGGAVAGLLRDLPWLARAVKWRFADKRQLFPDGADLVVHCVIEQGHERDSRITLSDTLSDAHGTPLPAIDWTVTPADVEQLHALADIFERHWDRGELAGLGTFERFPRAGVEQALVHSGGIYHPTGSTRMAASAADGVVDADLRLFAEPRVQLVGTSVLPSGGGANPTMTALLLAMRLAAQHGRASRRQGR